MRVFYRFKFRLHSLIFVSSIVGTMKWGEYLCRGTETLPLKSFEKSPAADVTEAFEKLSTKVEQALKHLGLSNFSSSVAKQYLIVSISLVIYKANFIQGKLNDGKADKLNHVIGYVVDLLNKKKTRPSLSNDDATQSGCPNVIPGLRAQPFWDTSNFPWVQMLESKYQDIKKEFIALRNRYNSETNSEIGSCGGSFQHYRSPKVSKNEESDELGAIATSKGLSVAHVV